MQRFQKVTPGSMGRGLVYSRVSNPNDTRENSLDTQEEQAAESLRSLGYSVDASDIFRERQSGKDYADRDVLNLVRDRLASGEYKAIGFYALDRLSRSMAHTALLFDEFERLGVVPVSATEDMSDNSPEGKLIRSVRSYVAEVERLKILDRTGRSRARFRELGQMAMASRAKFGYAWDKSRRARKIDEEEARIIMDIFVWCADGMATSKIAKQLSDMGVQNSSSRRGYKNRSPRSVWSGSTIQTIISDRAYLGWTIQNRFKAIGKPAVKDGTRPNKFTKVVERPEEEWDILDKEGNLTPQIISDTLWEAANRAMKARVNNKAATSVPHGTANFLLRGLMTCAVCGEKMYTYTEGKKTVRAYRCSTQHSVRRRSHTGMELCPAKRVMAHDADAAVWEQFKTILITPGLLEDAIRRISDKGDEKRIEADLATAKRQLQAKQDMRSKLYEKWRAELTPGGDEDFAAKLEADYRSLKPQVEQQKELVSDLTSRLAAIQDSPKAASGFRARFELLRDRLVDKDEVTYAERFEALRIAGTRIVGQADEIDVYFDVFGTKPATPNTTPRDSVRFCIKMARRRTRKPQRV